MRLGAHQSVAGGLERAVAAADRDGCEAVQIFTRNQQQWRAKPIADEEAERFRASVSAWGVARTRLLAHDSYLINLCARDRSIRRRSIDALVAEVERCARLGIGYVVLHPGSHKEQGERRGLELVAQGVCEVLERTSDGCGGGDGEPPPMLLVENTAGAGTALGHRFEHLRDLLAQIGPLDPLDRLGICIDTCHTYAAGYDLSSAEGYAETFREMDKVFGLEHVKAFHLNDSKRFLGSNRDRHELIGRGYIGRTAFRLLVNDVRFAQLPAVLELPPPYGPKLSGLRRMSDGRATARLRPPRRGL